MKGNASLLRQGMSIFSPGAQKYFSMHLLIKISEFEDWNKSKQALEATPIPLFDRWV